MVEKRDEKGSVRNSGGLHIKKYQTKWGTFGVLSFLKQVKQVTIQGHESRHGSCIIHELFILTYLLTDLLTYTLSLVRHT